MHVVAMDNLAWQGEMSQRADCFSLITKVIPAHTVRTRAHQVCQLYRALLKTFFAS